jgi:hypothetical protein
MTDEELRMTDEELRMTDEELRMTDEELRMIARSIGAPCGVSVHHGQPKGCQCSG